MDADAAAFVVDRVDVARMALMEARQMVEKFAQPEDAEVTRLLSEMLERVERLDAMVRSSPYPAP